MLAHRTTFGRPDRSARASAAEARPWHSRERLSKIPAVDDEGRDLAADHAAADDRGVLDPDTGRSPDGVQSGQHGACGRVPHKQDPGDDLVARRRTRTPQPVRSCRVAGGHGSPIWRLARPGVASAPLSCRWSSTVATVRLEAIRHPPRARLAERFVIRNLL